MSRYQEVYRMPAMMYAEGSPVLISAGTILKDTVKEQVLVQLKLQNLSDKVLISCKISIKAYEPSGSEIEGINNYAYLDLKENRGGYFGTKTPVYLPNVATRSFQPSVTEAVFSDGTMWSCSDQTLWKPLFFTRAENVFSSQELVEQYKLETGNDALYYPIIVRGLFLCTCGAVNIHNGDGCYLCNRRYENLIKLLDVEHLLNNRTERIRKEQEAKARKEREEREAAERAAAERAEVIRIREEARRKRNQIIKRVVIIVAPIILLAVITYGSVFHLYPAIQYKKAKEAVGNEQYDVAYDIYIKLGKYKKSPQKALAAIYSKAVTLEEQGLYEEAAIEYERVLGYEDSEEGFSYCKNMVQYSQGMSLFQEKQYEEAIKAFSEIQYFSDSLEWIKRSKYEMGNTYYAEAKYEEAYRLFVELGNYPNAVARANESLYMMGCVAIDEKDYQKAILHFGSLLGDFKDSHANLLYARYLYAEDCVSRGDYKEASDNYFMLKSEKYEDSSEKSAKTSYLYAKECYASRNYDLASEYFRRAGDYLDAAELFKDSRYEEALLMISNKEYYLAVVRLNSLDNYKDSKSKKKEAMYGYVKAHMSNENTTTYEYLKELTAINYLDTKSIYKSLYAWEVKNIYFNSRETSFVKEESIKRTDAVYCHFTLSGGPPGESIYVYCKDIFPDGSSSGKTKTNYKMQRGDANWMGWADGIYRTPNNGAAGTLTMIFYDEVGNKIGTGAVKITK